MFAALLWSGPASTGHRARADQEVAWLARDYRFQAAHDAPLTLGSDQGPAPARTGQRCPCLRQHRQSSRRYPTHAAADVGQSGALARWPPSRVAHHL